MDIDYTVGEVELSYKPKFKKLHKVVSSEDAYKYLLLTYKEGTICYKEYFKVLFLNQSNQVLGWKKLFIIFRMPINYLLKLEMEVWLLEKFFEICAPIILATAIFENLEFHQIFADFFKTIYRCCKVADITRAL